MSSSDCINLISPLLDAEVDSFSTWSALFCGLVSDVRRGGFFAVAVELANVFASCWLFEPELLRRVGSCSWELVDSESELDELLSEPLELSLDDDVPEVDPELDSVVLVDCKQKIFVGKTKHWVTVWSYLFPRRHHSPFLLNTTYNTVMCTSFNTWFNTENVRKVKNCLHLMF